MSRIKSRPEYATNACRRVFAGKVPVVIAGRVDGGDSRCLDEAPGFAVVVVDVVAMMEPLTLACAHFEPVRITIVDHTQVEITQMKRSDRAAQSLHTDGDSVSLPIVGDSHVRSGQQECQPIKRLTSSRNWRMS